MIALSGLTPSLAVSQLLVMFAHDLNVERVPVSVRCLLTRRLPPCCVLAHLIHLLPPSSRRLLVRQLPKHRIPETSQKQLISTNAAPLVLQARPVSLTTFFLHKCQPSAGHLAAHARRPARQDAATSAAIAVCRCRSAAAAKGIARRGDAAW